MFAFPAVFPAVIVTVTVVTLLPLASVITQYSCLPELLSDKTAVPAFVFRILYQIGFRFFVQNAVHISNKYNRQYYFSDFLSVIETRERKDGRAITDTIDLCAEAKTLIQSIVLRFIASNTNGYTDATHYQVYAPLKANSVLKATSELPGVKFEISPVSAGRATIRATYNGKTKTYLIN